MEEREVEEDRLDETVGVRAGVVATGEGLMLPVPHCVALPVEEAQALCDRDTLTVALLQAVTVWGAEVGAELELTLVEGLTVRLPVEERVGLVVPEGVGACVVGTGEKL